MKHIFVLAAFIIATSLTAQINHGGEPFEWKTKTNSEPEYSQMPVQDISVYQREDAINDQYKDIPYRFGANIPVELDIFSSGEWITQTNGDRVWRLGIESAGAVSLNFEFGEYNLPEGGKVFVYTPDMKQVNGSYTSDNMSPEGTLGVGLIAGDKMVIEYQEPSDVAGQGYLKINNITHGYREITHIVNEAKAGPFGNSGACNINVRCPVGQPYDLQIRSVALIVVGSNAVCTGSMVNNTAQNGIPYFLTANHCIGGNVNNWIFYFNHESPGCAGITGPTNQSLSGSTLLASSAESDFALLQLTTPPPANFNVCYNGWDATDLTSTVLSAYGIHHPSGDVKKICFENNAPFHEVLGTFVNQTWYINQWELGVTEGGSSGSPLFNQSGRVIGMLSGGQAACNGTVNNGQFDFYGRFGVAWNWGNSQATRLRDWLDPINSGILIMNNSCSVNNVPNDISLGAIVNLPNILCNTNPVNSEVTVLNSGTAAVTSFSINHSLNGSPATQINWNGNLAPSSTVTVSLGQIAPTDGSNNLTVNIVSVNGGTDQNTIGNTTTKTFQAFANPAYVTVTLNFDNYPAESGWNISSLNETVLYSGGPYTSGTQTFSETFCLAAGTCYNFNMLDSWGDGMCCVFGPGSYSVTDANGAVLASGGEFNFIETTQICTTPLSVTDRFKNAVKLYPNPAGSEAFIDFGTIATDNIEIRIIDTTGRAIWAGNANKNTAGLVALPISSLTAGVYLVQITTADLKVVQKLVVQR